MVQVDQNELKVAAAFSLQAPIFDSCYNTNTIIHYKRARVRDHVMQLLSPGSSMLELNCGTGEDAIFFAQNGYHVHATDISSAMLNNLESKVKLNDLPNRITFEACSYTNLTSLRKKGPYDFIFSNFAGLNCTPDLDCVLSSFNELLKPGGVLTLVLLPKFCLWETLLIFKGKFKTATRRWFSNKGAKAKVEGQKFKCWYYQPSYIVKATQENFALLSVEGLCTIVPPSYIEGFAEKYPRTYQSLRTLEDLYNKKWPWKYIGDYYIISLQKR